MSKIAGTIINIEDYLSTKQKLLSIYEEGNDSSEIKLQENRGYEIPLYQREIRWTPDNINRLIADLINGSKFLGNIILSINSNKYEIIDGQQRTTVILLIIAYIRTKFSEQLDIFETCDLINQSFTGLNELIDYDFNVDSIPPDKLDAIKSTDKYNQIDSFISIWESIKQSSILNDKIDAATIIKNLKSSEINIIASKASKEDISIQYFLDVNLKGVQLDTEDIFKGYLFSLDSTDTIRTLWQKYKQAAHLLNSSPNNKHELFPLMKMLEYYFKCELHKEHDEFKSDLYGTNFCLNQNIKINEKVFYKGTHIIEVLYDNEYMRNALKRCTESLNVLNNVSTNSSSNDQFKKLFKVDNTKKNEKIDDTEIQNFFYMMRRIILEKEIVPKILLLKYILDCFDGKIHSKEEYTSIYAIFIASVVFTVFSSKKDDTTFSAIVKSDNYISALLEWLYNYYNSLELKIGKLRVAYRYDDLENEVSRIQEIQCKSLATVLNFLKISQKGNNKYTFSVKNKEKMKDFLSNTSEYSIEHFIIPRSGILSFEYENEDKPVEYRLPSQIVRYRNALFNYIFIPKDLNNKIENLNPFQKISYLKKHNSDIKCRYSSNYIDMICKTDSQNNITEYNFFKDLPCDVSKYKTFEEHHKALDAYFLKQFPSDFLDFSTALIKRMTIIE